MMARGKPCTSQAAGKRETQASVDTNNQMRYPMLWKSKNLLKIAVFKDKYLVGRPELDGLAPTRKESKLTSPPPKGIPQQKASSPAFLKISTTEPKANHSGMSSADRSRL